MSWDRYIREFKTEDDGIDYDDLEIKQTEQEFMDNVDRGARIFWGKCAVCHTVSRNKHHKKGPSLFGVVGRKAGDIPGYEFSDALNKFSDKFNLIWNWKNFDMYLKQPQEFIPGSKMNFVSALPMKHQQRWMVYQFLKYHSPTNLKFIGDEEPEG